MAVPGSEDERLVSSFDIPHDALVEGKETPGIRTVRVGVIEDGTE